MTTTIVGVFNSDAQAQAAVRDLHALGITNDAISVVARDNSRIVDADGNLTPASDDHMTAGEGLTVGAVWGGLVGLAALAIPGIGPLIGAGALVAALTGAVAGAATGGIAGALINAASVPEDQAYVYEERVKAGNTLVTVHADDSQAAQVRSTLRRAGAERFQWDTDDDVAYDQSNEQAYADSSKIGTVGGGAAGAITGASIGAAGGPVGAVIGGVTGAVVGGAVGAAGDTAGEKLDDTTLDSDYTNRTAGAYDTTNAYSSNATYDRLNEVDATRESIANRDYSTTNNTPIGNRIENSVRDVTTDDQGDDTFRAADKAYDDSSKIGTAGGGAAGAVTGAAIGSVGGPVGAVVGGVVGGVAGAAVGAVGDTVGEQADKETGAFSPDNQAQYRGTASAVGDKLRDTGNSVERKLDTDIDRDGDVGRRG
ncbi:general stress protein [Herpetosiphon llansteffanensis]